MMKTEQVAKKTEERDTPRYPYTPDRNPRRCLVKKNANGEFWVEGVDIKSLPEQVYSCICKLKDYESCGFLPDEIDFIIQLYDGAVATIDKLKAQNEELREKLLAERGPNEEHNDRPTV